MRSMTLSSLEHRRRLASLPREGLAEHQLQRLNALLATILPDNAFYAKKLAGCRTEFESLEQLAELPLTTKEELLGEPGGPIGAANLTYPVERYVRFHQTSGTRGRPLAVLDTQPDWQWWLECWQYVLDAANVTAADRALLAFSFGPFIGFWSAHDAMSARGGLVVPGGGMSTVARLELLRTSRATLVFCTPTYALRMAEVARAEGIDLAVLHVRALIVAGEPGGSLPAVRGAIETAWGATVIDHSGATEVGAWGFGDDAGRGLSITESQFIAEFLSLETGRPAAEGELAELVLTNLGRIGCPVIRYRTGDLVRPRWPSSGAMRFAFLDGGVLGRADDMMIVRGVNIFPSSIEQIVRSFPEVVEYRLTVRRERNMDLLLIEVEDRAEQPERIAQQLELRLGLKIEVQAVADGALPRFEAKGRRFVDQRGPSFRPRS